MIGVAIVAHAAQIGGVEVADEVGVFLGPVGVDHNTAIVIGQGLTSASVAARGIASFWSRNSDTKGGIRIAASIALLAKASAICVNGTIFTSTSDERHARGLQHLADLIGRYRAGAIAADHLALELCKPVTLVLEVRPQHQVVPDRRRYSVGNDGDRQVLLDRVEITGRDAAGDHLQPVRRQQRDGVGGGVDVFDLEPDAGLLEIAALDRDELGAVGDRARHADADRRLLGGGGGRRAGNGNGKAERGEQQWAQRNHGSSSMHPVGRIPSAAPSSPKAPGGSGGGGGGGASLAILRSHCGAEAAENGAMYRNRAVEETMRAGQFPDTSPPALGMRCGVTRPPRACTPCRRIAVVVWRRLGRVHRRVQTARGSVRVALLPSRDSGGTICHRRWTQWPR